MTVPVQGQKWSISSTTTRVSSQSSAPGGWYDCRVAGRVSGE